MIGRLAFYAVEAALLAALAAGGLALGAHSLRRLGAPVHVGFRRMLGALWLGFAVVGGVFGEWIGPEFVLPYQFCFWLVIGSVLLWLFSFVGCGGTPGRSRQGLTSANERGPG